jgi:hypothetical protein
MKARALFAFVFVAAIAPSFALNGTILGDFIPASALTAVAGPGSSQIQAEATRTTTQAVMTQSSTLPDGWTLSGTLWLLLDSLPTNDPTQVPPDRLDLSSRLLQLEAQWQILPGALILDIGKQIIHPSSGFFKTPLNLFSRGPAGNVPQQIPAAAPQWEEGWWGVKMVGILGDWTLEDFLSPPLMWSDSADRALRYLSLRQDDLEDQVRIDGHLGAVDVQFLGLVSASDPGNSDSTVQFRGGAGVDSNLGDHLTLRAEATLSDSLDRLDVVDASSLAVADRTVAWVPQALAGFTWSIDADLSFMAEYYYDGLALFGDDYATALQYAQNRLSSASAAPDVAGQFGFFSLARNYVFFRLADDFTDRITGQGWTEINLQDLSGMFGVGIGAKYDRWGLSGSLTQTWGGAGTEAQLLPYLWQLDIELSFYFS